jgi:threonine/homoserine/homoserine lactone efflux protein
MSFSSMLNANIGLAYAAYAFGAASPGPSNLAVMATAMRAGRRSAIAFALGITSGSALWGLLALLGLSAVMTQYSQTLVLMKFAGGTYLLWLSFKSFRSALRNSVLSKEVAIVGDSSTLQFYYRGLAVHLTNPKAIFVWLSVITLALSNNSQRADAVPIVLGCTLIAAIIFCGYAILFSTSAARRIYVKLRRWFDGLLTVIFGAAGFRLLLAGVAV